MEDHNITMESRVILFMDIHNYSIAARALAGEQYGFLQKVYETLGDVVVEYKGEIVKYLGDALLCVFPADSENEAVECSLKLRKAFSDIVSRRGLLPDTEIEIGIGSGDVAVGTFGHESLRQKDVLGEEVNRVAMIGHHKGIAITERVYEEIKTSYETRRLPDFRVKWQDEPLKVWEVVE